MTDVAVIERELDANPLGDALLAMDVPAPGRLRPAILAGTHRRIAGNRHRRVATAAAAGTAAACIVAVTPAGHAIAHSVLPEGLQQRLGLVEGAPRTLTPPGGANRGATASHPAVSPIPCSAVPTPGPGLSGGGFECYPDLSIAAAQAKVAFPIATPSVLPAGVRYRGASTTGPHDVILQWLRSDGRPGALGLEIRDAGALAGGSAVPSGTVQRVSVGGASGYVVRGDYEDNGPGTAAHWNPNADDYELTWTRNGLTFNLTAGGLQLSVSDLVHIAESVG